MTEELLSELPQAQNTFFILFLLCFIANMRVLGRSRRLLGSMLRELFRKQERQSIFFETVSNEVLIKLILCLQSILMISIIVHCTFSQAWNLPFETTSQLFYSIGGTGLIILIFILYKFLTNLGVGLVFFQKEDLQLWNNLFFSIISLSGMILFIPAVLIFYFQNIYYICLSVALLYFLFVEGLMFYAIFSIFFRQKSALLYFILYLCAQELLPLFFVYKALAFFYRM